MGTHWWLWSASYAGERIISKSFSGRTCADWQTSGHQDVQEDFTIGSQEGNIDQQHPPSRIQSRITLKCEVHRALRHPLRSSFRCFYPYLSVLPGRTSELADCFNHIPTGYPYCIHNCQYSFLRSQFGICTPRYKASEHSNDSLWSSFVRFRTHQAVGRERGGT